MKKRMAMMLCLCLVLLQFAPTLQADAAKYKYAYSGSVSRSRAPGSYSVLDLSTFDYTDYANRYADIKAAFGYSAAPMYQNYLVHGEFENREAHLNPLLLFNAGNFDYVRYAEDYPDVAAAIGNNPTGLYNHFINNGLKEGRRAYSTSENLSAMLTAYYVAQDITEPDMTQSQKAQAVHDWMCQNIAFVYNDYMDNCVKERAFTYTAALIDHAAAAQGYAECYDLFMRILGINDRVIIGTANYVTGINRHAWNEVKIDGRWLSVDVTWDDPAADVGGAIYSYEYLLIPRERMAQNHQKVS